MEIDHREEVEVDAPVKRRRISIPRNDGQPYLSLFAGAHKRRESNSLKPSAAIDNCDDEKSNISFSATPKQAGQTVAPFLAKHIPAQYPPAGQVESSSADTRTDSNTKYCYRHRPDLKCRRQANEPSMEQLQNELQDLPQVDQQAIAHTWSIFSASPAKQRNLILQGILTQCCFPQLSYLSANVRELIRLDFLAALPPEVSFRVLCFLDTASLCRAAQVSQKWRTLADDDVVWHRMCEQHIDRKCLKCGWGLPLLERKRLRASKRQIQLRATGRGLNEWSPNITPLAEQRIAPSSIPAGAIAQLKVDDPLASPRRVLTPNTGPSNLSAPPNDESYFGLRTRPWKDVYKDRFKVGTNWKYGRFNTKVFRGHQNGVMCLQFDEHILATGSYDTTIKIWDIQLGEEIRTLRGHTSAVRCLQFDESKLISGSLDHQVRVWNWRTGQCVSTLSGHNAGILGLHFDSSILATASVDHTVRIWDFDDKSASVLRGHSDWVNSVKIDSASRTVFTASDDSLIKLWDLDSKTCIKSFEGHVGQVQQICPLPHDFEFDDRVDGVDSHDGGDCTSSNASLATSPAPAEQPVAEPYGPGFTTCDRPLPPRYILTAALDSTIRLWDTYTGKSLRTYFGHVEGVWTIAADPLRVVSGSQDRTVKVWDTRGKCERTFTGHSGPVTCIGLSDSRLVSGGEDSEVRMYSF